MANSLGGSRTRIAHREARRPEEICNGRHQQEQDGGRGATITIIIIFIFIIFINIIITITSIIAVIIISVERSFWIFVSQLRSDGDFSRPWVLRALERVPKRFQRFFRSRFPERVPHPLKLRSR